MPRFADTGRHGLHQETLGGPRNGGVLHRKLGDIHRMSAYWILGRHGLNGYQGFAIPPSQPSSAA
jgi:hypothetical protein